MLDLGKPEAALNKALPLFGQRLRALRRAAGMKQFALADELGVDQTSISRWESGGQLPSDAVQHKALSAVSNLRDGDFALRRLVESSGACVHLIDEATHT